MLESKIKLIRTQYANIIIVGVACLAASPFSSLALLKSTSQTQTYIAIFCISYWSLRKLKQSIFSLIMQKKTLYLWALHTFTRLEAQKPQSWPAYLQTIFQQKLYLVIGNKQSGKSTLLKSAQASELQLPFEYQKKGLITHTIWSFRKSLLLESTCLMPNNQETNQLQRNYWKNLFHINRWHNTHCGFDGMIVVLSIHNILNEKKSHPTQSIDALNNQIKNITSASRDTPIFIVLTGLDYIQGFQNFFKHIDRDDVDSPLGFIIPSDLQFTTDIQKKLDKVANDIEAYLIYQLEKIIQGEKNDVEKMHIFHEKFKALKPKIVQILFGLKTHIKNPIAGILFTAYHEKEELSTQTSSQFNTFCHETNQNYFNKQVLSTIDDHIPWQPSKKLQQYALLGIGILAWYFSNIVVNETLITSIQENINYIYSHEHIPSNSVNHRKAMTANKQFSVQTPANAGAILNNTEKAKTKKVKPIAPTLEIKSEQTKSRDKEPKKNVTNLTLWDTTKQIIDHNMTNCNILTNQTCQQMAVLLSSISQSSQVSKQNIELLKQFGRHTKGLETESTFTALQIDREKRIELNYLIQKLKKNQPSTTLQNAAQKIIDHSDPNFKQQSMLDKILNASSTAKQACQQLIPIQAILSLPATSLATCTSRVSDDIKGEAVNQTLLTFNQSLKNYHNDKTIELLLKKSLYLHDNIHLITNSMRNIENTLQPIQNHQTLLSNSQQKQLNTTLNQASAFNEKTYQHILKKIILFSKEILQSKNQNLAALQVLETLIHEENSPKLWRKQWSDLDSFSQSCITAFEEVIIQKSGILLNDMWTQTILIPYKEAIANQYPFAHSSKQSVNLEVFHDFFSNKGVINNFFNKYLHSIIIIDKESGPKWKTLHGKELPFNKGISSFIMGSNIIQKMFYPNNTPAPWFEGVLRYRYASEGIKSIDIIQDNHKQTLHTKQTTPIHVKWPHANEKFSLAVNLENGETVTIAREEGPWSMIKLLSKAIGNHQGQKEHILKFKHYNLIVELEFESQNNISPLSAQPETFFQVPNLLFNEKH